MAPILVSNIDGECICRHIGPYARGGGLQIDIEVVLIVIIITVTQKTWSTLFVICTIRTLLMETQIIVAINHRFRLGINTFYLENLRIFMRTKQY